MSASISGLSELERNLNEVLKKSNTMNLKALTDISLDLLGKSVELAPVDKGDLRGSGSVTINSKLVAKSTSSGALSIVTSGNEQGKESILGATIGFQEPYAVRQHEHQEYSHPQGGEAKYLEKPFRGNIKKYINHIANQNKKLYE